MDRVMLILATLLVVAGFFILLHPQNVFFGRATNYPKNRQQTLIEHIDPSQSRLYGLLAIIGGAGLATFILWAARQS